MLTRKAVSRIINEKSAISRSGYLQVFLSKNSVASQWVARELAIGIDRELKERRVYVLPVLLEDCSVPLFLTDKLYVDMRKKTEEAGKKIRDTLRRLGSW